jgi:hypothetical protein
MAKVFECERDEVVIPWTSSPPGWMLVETLEEGP